MSVSTQPREERSRSTAIRRSKTRSTLRCGIRQRTLPIPSVKETILDLVRELSSLDRSKRVFGAERRSSGWGHEYRFNKPLTADRVAEFETQNGIRLPEDYREFIQTVGDGGAGPHYGIKSLADSSEYSRLSVPFPWSAELTLSSDEDRELWETYPGALVVSERGCAYCDVLIVNGDAHGRIWSDFTAVDCPLSPTHDSFLSWYVDWATRCINTIRREPLLDRIAVGMTIEELKQVLGPDIQRWDSTALLPSSPAYYVGFTNTNASFEIDENDRVKKINKMNQV